MLRVFAILLALLPTLASAQNWPEHASPYVNDQANVIEAEAEARITTALETLRKETGVEATVLTLYTRWGFESTDSVAHFATGLFNHWSIGDAERKDGILILVVTEDREIRVELGAGYPPAARREATDIVDNVFLPTFREGDFSKGIEDGTAAVIARIARPHHDSQQPAANSEGGEQPAAKGEGGGMVGKVIIGAVAALFALIIGKTIVGQRCPECGKRGLKTHRKVLTEATEQAAGTGEKTVECKKCGYRSVTSYTIPRRSSSSDDSFGGGSSSGDGASGRW